MAASQAYAFKFGLPPHLLPPKKEKEAMAWLSRGLMEALVAFIGQADSPQFALRAAVYQFTDPDVLAAFHDAHVRGADVQIVYHDTGGEGAANDAATRDARIRHLLIPRTKAANIAHNKFVVLCSKDPDGTLRPVSVWTGSTNMSEGGIFGHSNVGHAVRDPDVAARYLDYWTQLSGNPGQPLLQQWIDSQNPFSEAGAQASPGTQSGSGPSPSPPSPCPSG